MIFPKESDLKLKICSFLKEHKIFDITIINDINNTSTIFDWIVVANGRSQKHIKIIAELLKSKMKNQGLKKIRIEGLPNSGWILIDFFDGIVNLFQPNLRELYALEKIWNNLEIVHYLEEKKAL